MLILERPRPGEAAFVCIGYLISNAMARRRTLIRTKTHKQCCTCKEVLEHACFNKSNRGDGLQGTCRECHVQYASPDYRRMKRYGLNREELENRLAIQNGLCAICQTSITLEQPATAHIDHNHETTVIRGLLCNSCNRGIGLFKDEPERLERAAVYLRRFASKEILVE